MSLLVRAALAALALAAFAALAPDSRAAAPVPGEAGKAMTFPFPAKAPVVVQVNGLGTARDRLTALLKSAVPDDAEAAAKQFDAALKELLADRKLTAVPKDGRVFFVVNDIASLFENAPTVSLLVPVTGYKEFRETFLTADERKTFESGKNGVDEAKLNLLGDDHPVFLVDLKEYVAITPDRGTADVYAGKYTRATTAAMPPELARSFVTADVSAYVNLDVINDLYGDKIRAFRGLIDFAIQQAAMGGMIPGMSKKQLEAAKTLIQGAFQAVEDARGVVAAVEFRPEGLNLRLQAQFAEDTTSVKVLKAEQPGPLADVGKLPAGMHQYGGTKFGKKFHEAMRGLNPEFAPADDDEKGNAAVDKRQKDLLAAGPLGEVSATGEPHVALTVAAFTDPKKAAAAIVGCYEAMAAGGRVHNVVLKDAPKVKADAKTHQNFTFTEVRLAFDFEATVKDLPEGVRDTTLAQIKSTMAEKMTVWIGTDGKTVVEATAKDWDAAAGALDQYLGGKKPVSATDGYKLTRKNLPPDASLMTLMETGQTLTTLLDTARSMEGVVPGFPRLGQVKPLKGEPSYVGVAVTLKGDTATANVFVPATAIGVARKMLDGLFKKLE
ncbi:MAG: hypothetical protein J0I06_01195 [Planctomycetes bacterium]|nr:hypothetical protein [Planctomycetota bacterium]